jgi:hypothetical protein
MDSKSSGAAAAGGSTREKSCCAASESEGGREGGGEALGEHNQRSWKTAQQEKWDPVPAFTAHIRRRKGYRLGIGVEESRSRREEGSAQKDTRCPVALRHRGACLCKFLS